MMGPLWAFPREKPCPFPAGCSSKQCWPFPEVKIHQCLPCHTEIQAAAAEDLQVTPRIQSPGFCFHSCTDTVRWLNQPPILLAFPKSPCLIDLWVIIWPNYVVDEGDSRKAYFKSLSQVECPFNILQLLLPTWNMNAMAGTAAAVLWLWGNKNECKNLHTENNGTEEKELGPLMSLLSYQIKSRLFKLL